MDCRTFFTCEHSKFLLFLTAALLNSKHFFWSQKWIPSPVMSLTTVLEQDDVTIQHSTTQYNTIQYNTIHTTLLPDVLVVLYGVQAITKVHSHVLRVSWFDFLSSLLLGGVWRRFFPEQYLTLRAGTRGTAPVVLEFTRRIRTRSTHL